MTQTTISLFKPYNNDFTFGSDGDFSPQTTQLGLAFGLGGGFLASDHTTRTFLLTQTTISLFKPYNNDFPFGSSGDFLVTGHTTRTFPLV